MVVRLTFIENTNCIIVAIKGVATLKVVAVPATKAKTANNSNFAVAKSLSYS